MDKKQIETLLTELNENRNSILERARQLEDLANRIDDLLPKEYTPRNRFVFEDRVKLLSMLFDTLLRYRTEVGKQIEKEITIIQNVLKEEADDNLVTRISAMPKEEALELIERIKKKAVSDNI